MRQVQAAKVESFVFKKNKIWHKCKILTFFWVFTVYFYCWHTSQESIEAAGRLHARSLANWSSDTEIVLSTPACIWELLARRRPWRRPGDSASNHLQLTTEHPGSYSVVSTQKLQSSSSINIGFGFILCFILFCNLFQRIRHYMDWSLNSVQFLALKELHETFLDCFLTTASKFDKKKDEGKCFFFFFFCSKFQYG